MPSTEINDAARQAEIAKAIKEAQQGKATAPSGLRLLQTNGQTGTVNKPQGS